MNLPSVAVLALVGLACGCGGVETTSGASAHDDSVCSEIGHACHDADSGDGEAHDCHVSAHTVWTPAECAQQRDHCLTACVAHGHDPSHGEASGATASDEDGTDHPGS